MSEIRTSFYYDPIRSGYDANLWRTLSGSPAIVAGGRLSVDNGADAGSAIHYADFVKGDISFNVNVPSAPGALASRVFGVSAPNTAAYIRFVIDDALTCQTSDGVDTAESATIQWNSDWTGANIVFRIRWEGGTAKFFVNGTQVYAITGPSVPYGPLSLYLSDDSAVPMTIGDINVRGTQSYVMNLKTTDPASFDGLLLMSQGVSVAESINLLLVNLSLPYNNGNLFESVTVTEGLTFRESLPLKSEAITITESTTLTIV